MAKSKNIRQLSVFGFFGIVVQLVSVPLNLLFVEVFHLEKTIAYLFVMIFVLTFTYLINRNITFRTRGPRKNTFPLYVGSSFLIRFADWLLYNIEVYLLSVPYVLAQSANIIIFFFLKFFLFKRIFEGGSNAGG